ncbi:hypothetical protein SWQG_00012 [Synechococcus phage S-RIP2]|uniref:Internal virion protein n=2 Tax=Sednavirus SRIP2 TaxID=2733955 RepID=M4SNU7_9CAUD|nr:hypothetical protein SWQG_00012 [Synechococcus phage S-RIP2]YP_007676325.1 hypothetical protein CYZG_00003 [Cyanophage KBS-P-1A]AGG91309.1 hypothetical protein SWQG_00012 [Synechococcus phage S-RIP2]AGH57698.1 hypothetical protein CYZG_00003 [Cyanophage KBS-P-1A]
MAIGAISAGLGIVQGVASIFGSKPVQDRSAQIGAAAYNNLLSQRKTEIMNAYRQRAFDRKVEQVYKQFDENFAAANASFQTEQAKFGEQMMAFAFQKEGMMRQLMEAEGYAAATESYGRSADRAKAIKTLGDYGRNNAKFIESVVSAQRQYGRDVGGIGGSLAQANVSASAPIIDGGPISEMAPRGYIPPYTQNQGGGFFNTAMKVMGGIQSGLSMYKQFDTAFNPDSAFRKMKIQQE